LIYLQGTASFCEEEEKNGKSGTEATTIVQLTKIWKSLIGSHKQMT